MVDIDRFKALNDAHGHQVGDEVLRAVAGAIGGAVREDDVPARYGGEEFAVLLRNPTLDVAVEVGERVREAVARLDLRRFGVAAVSVSVGAAVADDADEPIDAIDRSGGPGAVPREAPAAATRSSPSSRSARADRVDPRPRLSAPAPLPSAQWRPTARG